MTREDYEKYIRSKTYDGLEMIRMGYDEAYEFAGEYGMNAIIINATTPPPHELQFVRLYQGVDAGTLCYKQDCQLLQLDRAYDIYWIGMKLK